jgi:lysozyme family protein
MSASSYDEALARLLVHEGGYSNHPSDPGGPTNFGITLRDARAWWKKDATAADVRNLPLAVAKSIYRTKYWAALRCDELPAGVDYAVFDYGVNSGIGRAAKVLQRLLGLPDDGIVGPRTLVSAACADAGRLIDAICDERLAFLQGLKTWPVFGNGWGRRVREVRAAALAIAARDKAARKAEPPASPAPSSLLRHLTSALRHLFDNNKGA